MNRLEALRNRYQQLDTGAVIEEVFVANETFIAEENKKQLKAGFDKDGNRLRPYKSPAYARLKFAQNPIPGLGNPDFYRTGAFYRQWQVKVDGDVIRNVLNDPKSVFLLDRDPGITGLGGEYRKEVLTKVAPEILADIREKLKV